MRKNHKVWESDSPPATAIGGWPPISDYLCEGEWLLKKSLSGKSAVKIGELKCIPEQRKSFVEHPDAK